MSVVVNRHYDLKMFQQDTQALMPKYELQRLANEPAEQIAYEDKISGVKGCKRLTAVKSAHSAKVAYQNDGVFNDNYLNPYQQNKLMMGKYFKALINIFGSAYLLPTLQLSSIPIVAGTVAPPQNADCKKTRGRYPAYNQLMAVKKEFMANPSSMLAVIENSQSTNRQHPTNAHIHLHTMSLGDDRDIEAQLKSIAPAGYRVQATQMTYYNLPVRLTPHEAYSAYSTFSRAYNAHSNKKLRAKSMWQAIKSFRFNLDITAICHYVSYCYKQYRFPIAYNKPKSEDPKHIHAKLVWQNWNRLSPKQTKSVLQAIKRSTYGKQLHTAISLKKTFEAMLAGLYFVMHEAGIVAQQSCLDLSSVDANPQTAYYARSAFSGTVQHHHYTTAQNIRRAYQIQNDQIAIREAVKAIKNTPIMQYRHNSIEAVEARIHTLVEALAVEPRLKCDTRDSNKKALPSNRAQQGIIQIETTIQLLQIGRHKPT